MESWIKKQYNFYNYRSQSFRASVTLKSLFIGNNWAKNETDPFLTGEDEKEEKIWRRFSLQSFRKRKEKKQEEKSKPVLPAVLRTYDKQKQLTNRSCWL
ncbi:hypothetical protein BDFB_002381 [Asbolus verrucosus]|uniref:Uncharacterized protein n=1 Tax=Asbolus verrucosus TaxID=1661398 RepID=A0A482V6V2_ASBVE|nr:hypothetical protein BDFB_002381 [Asbolus verrucosus]